MKGQICYLFDNTPAIIVKVNDFIWASTYAVLPLVTTPFYKAGEVEQVLQAQCKIL